MKIGIVCVNLSFVAGGPRLVLGLAQALKKLGHNVIVYAPDFDAEHYKDYAAGLDIRIVKPHAPLIWAGRSKNIFEWAWHKIEQERRLIDASRRIADAMDADFDIINVHDFAYRAGYFYKKINLKAHIIWTENAPPHEYISKNNFFFDVLGAVYKLWKRASSRKYFRAIDKVAVLDFLNEKWAKEQGLKNIRVIRCGVDFKKFYVPVKDFTEKAKKKSVQLFALGALNLYRRYDIVARAVKILRDKGIDARALIICNNIWKEDAMIENLKKLVKELGIEQFIDFRFAGVSEEDLRKAYATSDFFVQAVYVTPPGNHGWGIVNFEGMSAGLPVILVRSATATEVLKDNENAFFMDPLAPEQIAEKVERCIADPKLYKRVAEAGQNVARGMTWEKYTEETLALFQK
jgi:glycosyltransferase involved in cell wall biosynthesis